MEKEHLTQIKTRIADSILVSTAILFFPVYLLTVLRGIEIGWNNVYLINSVVFLLIALIAIFRKRLSSNLKSIFLVSLYASVGFIGLWKFGFSSTHYFLVMSVALITLVSGKKVTYIAFTGLFLVYIAFAIAFSTNTITTSVDLNMLSTSLSHWGTIIFSLFALSVISVSGYRNFFKELMGAYSEKKNISEVLQKQNDELIRARQKAKESEVIISELSKNLTSGMIYQIVVDSQNERRFTFLSDSVETFYGCTAEEAKADASIIYSKVHPDDQERLQQEEFIALRDLTDFNVIARFIKPDGTIRWGSIKSTPRKVGDLVFWDGIEIDITEIKDKEEQLTIAKDSALRNEARLKEAQELGKIGSWEYDIRNSKIYWSDEMYRIIGCQPNEVEPNYETYLKYVHPKDRIGVKRAYVRHLSTRKPYNIIHRIVISGTEECKFVNERCEFEVDADGKPFLSRGTLADITETIATQNELRDAKERAEESNRLKTEFINNMSHEIRTPLNGLLGFSSLFEKENLLPEKRKLYVDVIQNSGRQLVRIIDDIIEISKLGTNQVKVKEQGVCLNHMLLQLFAIFDVRARQRKISLYLKKGLSDDASIIFTDEIKLHRILSNLLDNALNYTQKGFIELGYKLKNNSLLLYVKDTGSGIGEDTQKTIFERFTRENTELSNTVGGLGLGLSIAKENAELLGGSIHLESKKGEGSTFTVQIPFRPINQSFCLTTAERDDSIKKKKSITILIAEDEGVNFMYLEEIIKTMDDIDCRVLHAKNGLEAIELCQIHKDISLVFMDIKMPVVNGFEATKEIKSFRQNLPIIAQTAYSSDADLEQAFDSGCDEFISKPIEQRRLFETIYKYVK